MKHFIYILLIAFTFASCNTAKQPGSTENGQATQEQDTVRIENDELEYEIIIIEPGFNTWLAATARPEGYYSQEYMENRNRQYVIAWNQRVIQPSRYNRNLYELQIDYDPLIDYGYEVNYKLYNYFIYFQMRYNQRLAGWVPRI